ncbi:hypothetical protein GGP53_003180 [Salinibacter ruber]|nr:hypothetical protein [Salinibacter ruber]
MLSQEAKVLDVLWSLFHEAIGTLLIQHFLDTGIEKLHDALAFLTLPMQDFSVKPEGVSIPIEQISVRKYSRLCPVCTKPRMAFYNQLDERRAASRSAKNKNVAGRRGLRTHPPPKVPKNMVWMPDILPHRSA